ncbi:MAG: hypothetical protein WD468_05075, partial [Pirellulales bacterium]
MENRLMLSATSLGDAPFSWPSPPVGMQVGEFALVAAPAVPISSLPDGGFINSNNAPAEQDAVSFAVNRQGQPNLSIADLLNQSPLAFANDSMSTNGGSVLFTQGTNGIVPRVIFASDFDGTLSAAGQVFVNGNFYDSSQLEGGAISIESILSTIGPGVESKFTAPSLAKTTFIAPSEAESSTNPATSVGKSSNHEISGEWARAAVFEIAGGEPAPVSLQAKGSYRDLKNTSREIAVPRDHQPLSSHDAERGEMRLAAHNAASQMPAQPFPVDLIQAASSNRRPSAMVPSTAVIDRSGVPPVNAIPLHDQPFGDDALPKMSDSANGNRAAQTDAQPNAAAAAVFDEIGTGNAALASQSAEDQPLRYSIGINPLLLMLAL